MKTHAIAFAPPPAPAGRFDDLSSEGREALLSIVRAFWDQVRGWAEKVGCSAAEWEISIVALIDDGWMKPMIYGLSTKNPRAEMLFWDGEEYLPLQDLEPERREFLIDLCRTGTREENAA
jgi:hypothetical protein